MNEIILQYFQRFLATFSLILLKVSRFVLFIIFGTILVAKLIESFGFSIKAEERESFGARTTFCNPEGPALFDSY